MNNNSLQVTQIFTDKLHVSYKQISTFIIAFFLYKVSFFHLQKCLLSHFKDNIHNVSDFDSHVGSATGTDHRLVSPSKLPNNIVREHYENSLEKKSIVL